LITVDNFVNNTFLALTKVNPFFRTHKCAIPLFYATENRNNKTPKKTQLTIFQAVTQFAWLQEYTPNKTNIRRIRIDTNKI